MDRGLLAVGAFPLIAHNSKQPPFAKPEPTYPFAQIRQNLLPGGIMPIFSAEIIDEGFKLLIRRAIASTAQMLIHHAIKPVGKRSLRLATYNLGITKVVGPAKS